MKIIEYIELIDRDDILIHVPNEVSYEEDCDRCILLISHELSRTGAPQQLIELAVSLLEQGYRPFVYSLSEGDLIEDFSNIDVITICEIKPSYNSKWMSDFISIFEVIFINTLLLADYVKLLAPVTKKLFWWIHESSFLFDLGNSTDIPDTPSLKIIAASTKTEQSIKRYLNRNSTVINVCTRDYRLQDSANRNSKTVFLWAGSIDYNKAPDLLLRAIAGLTQDELSEFEVLLYGQKRRKNEYTDLVEKFIDLFPNIHLMEPVSHDELMSVMKDVDAVVITSNEESTGLVAVEGLMMGKPVICSDGCGVADNLDNGVSGLVFRSGDQQDLTDKIRFSILHPQEINKIGSEGRSVYEKNYSYEIFNRRIISLLDETDIINNNMNACSGCGACALQCPTGAIHMVMSDKGFLYPEVITEKCVKCGQCRSICQVNSIIDINRIDQNMKSYAFRLSDEAKRMESQSGGAFSSFAEAILKSGGVVFGVELTKEYNAVYTEIDDFMDLNRLKGSKYVQADTGKIYEKVKNRLLEGKKVLFEGTSCHVDGLYKFLKDTDISNLYTCDLVCHGVPSIAVFKKYIDYQKARSGGIEEYNFRDKSIGGWHLHIETWKNERSEINVSTDYTDLFYSNTILRECCYSCRYASFNKPADITIGDFWGIENVLPEMDDNKGVSLVIIRTDKGNKLFQDVKELADVKEVSKESCIQPNLIAPTKRPLEVDKFWDEYNRRPYKYLLQSFTGRTYNRRFQSQIMNYLNNKDLLAKRMSEYLKKHNFNISGICGDDLIIENIINDTESIFGNKPSIINVFDDEKEIRIIQSVSVEEYKMHYHTGKVLVLDEAHFEAYLSELRKKGLEPADIIPISFILDEEV